MLFKSKLPAAIMLVLLAVAWVVLGLLIGLGVGPSLAVAAVLAIAAVPWLVHRSSRRPHRPGQGLRPRRSARGGPQRVTRFGDYTENHGHPSGKTRHGVRDEAHVPQLPQTLVTQFVQLIVDDGGFAVKKRQKTATWDFWEDHLRVAWPDVKAIAFATDRHDPIVALYAWTTSGTRHHVADSRFLSQSEWTELVNLISWATRGRLTLDLAGRDDPRNIRPDWLSG